MDSDSRLGYEFGLSVNTKKGNSLLQSYQPLAAEKTCEGAYGGGQAVSTSKTSVYSL